MNRRVRLTEADTERIRLAVEAAEKKTSGEIRPVILASSANYERATWASGLLGALIASLVLVVAHHLHGRAHWNSASLVDSPEIMLLAQAFGMTLGFGAARFSGIRRLFLSKAHLAQAVDAQAKQLFVELGLSKTRDRTGVLLLVSMFERRVEILADEGIHRRVPEGFWDSEVKTLVNGIHDDRFTDSLCQVVNDISEKLATHFPRQADDVNELPDAPVVRT